MWVSSQMFDLHPYNKMQIHQIAVEHYSALIHVLPLIDLLSVKVQTPISDCLFPATRKDFRNSFTRAVAHCIYVLQSSILMMMHRYYVVK